MTGNHDIVLLEMCVATPLRCRDSQRVEFMIRMDVSRMKSWLEKSSFGLPPFVTEAASSENGSEKRVFISSRLSNALTRVLPALAKIGVKRSSDSLNSSI